ncbi:hypothetical protein ABKN59_011529 [Abortiporus biennis]
MGPPNFSGLFACLFRFSWFTPGQWSLVQDILALSTLHSIYLSMEVCLSSDISYAINLPSRVYHHQLSVGILPFIILYGSILFIIHLIPNNVVVDLLKISTTSPSHRSTMTRFCGQSLSGSILYPLKIILVLALLAPVYMNTFRRTSQVRTPDLAYPLVLAYLSFYLIVNALSHCTTSTRRIATLAILVSLSLYQSYKTTNITCTNNIQGRTQLKAISCH